MRRIILVFDGINLENVATLRCFEWGDRLHDLGTPVIHDHQHVTAYVLLAGLIKACQALGRQPAKLHKVISGAGAAWARCWRGRMSLAG